MVPADPPRPSFTVMTCPAMRPRLVRGKMPETAAGNPNLSRVHLKPHNYRPLRAGSRSQRDSSTSPLRGERSSVNLADITLEDLRSLSLRSQPVLIDSISGFRSSKSRPVSGSRTHCRSRDIQCRTYSYRRRRSRNRKSNESPWSNCKYRNKVDAIFRREASRFLTAAIPGTKPAHLMGNRHRPHVRRRSSGTESLRIPWIRAVRRRLWSPLG